MDDHTFIMRRVGWPQWPFLPLKKRASHQGGSWRFAVLFASDPFMVAFDVNLFTVKPPQKDNPGPWVRADINALLKDGWKID